MPRKRNSRSVFPNSAGKSPVDPDDYRQAILQRKSEIETRVEKAAEILIRRYKDDPNLTYKGYLIKDNYFYGWFEENDSTTADGLHINRINISTLEIEEEFAAGVCLFWHINLNDFVILEER